VSVFDVEAVRVGFCEYHTSTEVERVLDGLRELA
jgi:selenocysteine lyase/cysteine desulfurase